MLLRGHDYTAGVLAWLVQPTVGWFVLAGGLYLVAAVLSLRLALTMSAGAVGAGHRLGGTGGVVCAERLHRRESSTKR